MQQAQPCLCLRHLNESEHEGQLCLCCIQSTLVYDTDMTVAYGLSKDKCITQQILTTYFRGNTRLFIIIVQSFLIAPSYHLQITCLQVFSQDYILLHLHFAEE